MTLAGIHAEWDRPTDYERWYSSSLGRSYGLSVEQSLRPWLASAAGKTLADIGCGPGLMIERLLPRSTQVVGIDCSFKMARRAAVRTQELGRPHRFVIGSITRVPPPDACLDYAVCVNCMEFVDDRRAAFAEVARTLRTHGVAIIGVLNRQSVWEITRRVRRPFSDKPYYKGRFFSQRELRANLESAGLHVEELETVAHFPLIPPGPFANIYRRLDAARLLNGGVILCRAMRA